MPPSTNNPFDTDLGKQNHRRWPLWRQIAVALTVSVLIVTVVVGELARRIEGEYLTDLLRRNGEMATALVSATAVDAVIIEDIPVLQTVVEQSVAVHEAIVAFEITDAEGRVLAAWGRKAATDRTDLLSTSNNIIVAGQPFGAVKIAWDAEIMFQDAKFHIRILLIFVVVSLLVVTAIFTLLGHILVTASVGRIDRRLRKLMTEKQLDEVELPRFAARELLDLNHLVSGLSKAWDDLKEAKATLDLRVHERTLELSEEITERKQAEEALRENEDRFKAIFDNSPASITLKDLDGRYLLANAEFLNRYGLKQEDVLGRTVHDFVPDGYAELQADLDRRVLDEKATIEKEVSPVYPDGSAREVLIIKFPVLGAGEEPVAIGTITTDITERKRAEEELRESERRYRDVVDDATMLIVRFRPDTTLTFVNTTYAVQRQTPPEQLIGRKFIDFLPDDEINELFAYLAFFTIDEPVKNREIRARHPDGTIHWRAWTHRAFFDDDGEMAEFQAVGHDITERKQAEELLMAAIEGMPEGFAYYDTDDRLAVFNKKMALTYPLIADVYQRGTTFEEVLRTGIERGQFVEAQNQEEEFFKEKLAYHRDPKGAVEYELPDGRCVRVEEKKTPEGGIVGIRTDITERKRAEEQIKASLAEKEVLLREIHHRVKNNLQVITSMLSLQAGTETDNHSIEVLKESQRRVGVMARIHETLHQSDDLASINARDYLDTLVEDTKASSRQNAQGISFHLEADDIIFDVDHAVPCGQIISELLSN